MNVRRRSFLTGSAAMAAFAAMQGRAAAADVPFTTFPFPGTGEPTARTMPDRIAEIKNVLDFGADPTGANPTATTAAIQAAINATGTANAGTIFFPTGFYLVNAPLTFNYNGNLSIHFLGAEGVTITGNFAGYIFDRHNTNAGSPNNTTGGRVFEKLNISNPNNAGGCVRIGSTIGAAFRDCLFAGNVCVTAEDSAGNSSKNILFDTCNFVANGTASPTNSVIIGGGGAFRACDFRNSDTGIRAYGNGLSIMAGRHENMNTAMMLGVDSAGTPQTTSGILIGGCSFEGNGTSIDFVGPVSGFVIQNLGAQGHDKSNSGYPLGVTNSQYGFRVRAGNATAGAFYGVTAGSQFDVACIAIGNASSRANVLFEGVAPVQTGGAGVSWLLPTNAYTVFFDTCNISPVWTFSQLPSGAGNVFEGDEFNISDSSTATWGATVSGGGSNHALVRYNGSNWTVVGI
jgi:hypothetical protein